jgi:hypothetical protein
MPHRLSTSLHRPTEPAEGDAAALRALFEQEKQLRDRNSLLVRVRVCMQALQSKQIAASDAPSQQLLLTALPRL